MIKTLSAFKTLRDEVYLHETGDKFRVTVKENIFKSGDMSVTNRRDFDNKDEALEMYKNEMVDIIKKNCVQFQESLDYFEIGIDVNIDDYRGGEKDDGGETTSGTIE